jgi:hypothetical protein
MTPEQAVSIATGPRQVHGLSRRDLQWRDSLTLIGDSWFDHVRSQHAMFSL